MIEQEIGDELRIRGLTLSLAGSRTGGLVARRITNVSTVGLVYIALATKDHAYHEEHILHKDREGNKHEAADATLKMLKRLS